MLEVFWRPAPFVPLLRYGLVLSLCTVFEVTCPKCRSFLLHRVKCTQSLASWELQLPVCVIGALDGGVLPMVYDPLKHGF